MTNKCRFCFEYCTESIHLLENNARNIVQIIELYFQCKIIKSDPLPKYMCTQCNSKINDFHKFHQKVQRAQDRFLKNLVKAERSPERDLPEINFVECRTESLVLPQEAVGQVIIKHEPNGFDDFLESPDYRNFDMKCELCENIFTNLEDAQCHYRDDHSMRGYLKCCGQKLKTQNVVGDHIAWHNNSYLFKCKMCNKVPNSRQALQRHMIAHKERRFTCDTCSKRFSTKAKVLRHILSVHVKPDRTFHCPTCKKSFPFKDNLNTHIKTKHGTTSCICEVCAKQYPSEVALRAHMKTHGSKVARPPAQCKVCKTWVGDQYRLKTHMLIHTSEPQKCHICGKFSPTPNALQIHMKSIHRERTHRCHLCDKAFKNDIVLKGHIATHTGERPYGCNYCSQTFIWRQDMYNHQKKIHPVEWSNMKRRKVGGKFITKPDFDL